MWLANCIQSLGDSSTKRKTSNRSLPPSPRTPEATVDVRHFGGGSLSSRSLSTHGDSGMSKFRNSKLTLLLSNALSGNSKTSMIGTLSPALANLEESMSTLNFASNVKGLKVSAKPAKEVDKDALVKSLQMEIQQLKKQLEGGVRNEVQAKELADEVEVREDIRRTLSMEWHETKRQSVVSMERRRQSLDQIGGLRRLRFFSQDLPTIPHLANFSDDQHLRGRLRLAPSEVGRVYTAGYSAACDFVVPHSLGVGPLSCEILHDSDHRLWVRCATDDSMQETTIEVNRKGVRSEWTEMQHHDTLVIGQTLMFYVFTKADGGMDALPFEKLCYPFAGGMNASELVEAVIGEGRADDDDVLHIAQACFSHLQAQNLGSEGEHALHEFMRLAQSACKKVEEANALTQQVLPESGISFELSAVTPLFAYGFGDSTLPELCVRVVRGIPEEEMEQRQHVTEGRRQSTLADVSALGDFVHNGEMPNLQAKEPDSEVLYYWTFSKFVSRLHLMHDIHATYVEDPKNFVLDPLDDPWHDGGPGELKELVLAHAQELRDAENQILELTEIVKDKGAESAPAQPQYLPSSAWSELQHLREANQKLEEENARLKALQCQPNVMEMRSAPVAGARDIKSMGEAGEDPLALLSSILRCSRKNVQLVASLTSRPPQGRRPVRTDKR